MTARRPAWVFLAGLLAAAACADAGRVPPMPPGAYARRVSDGVVDVHWTCSRPAAGLLRVEGVVNNPAGPGPLRDVQLTLYGVDRAGRDVSRVRGETTDSQIFTMWPSPFRLELRLAGEEVRFDLLYEYRGASGGGSGDEGGPSAPVGNLARDVCRGLRGARRGASPCVQAPGEAGGAGQEGTRMTARHLREAPGGAAGGGRIAGAAGGPEAVGSGVGGSVEVEPWG